MEVEATAVYVLLSTGFILLIVVGLMELLNRIIR